MTRTFSILSSFGLGAGMAYLFDRDAGRRRRAEFRDRSFHGLKVAGRGIQTGARDLGNRTQGLLAEARHIADREPVADEVLRERVRSKLGRLVSHPHAVRVEVTDGIVTLSGDATPSDAHILLEAIPKVRGVKHVEDRFAIYCNPEHVPSLQGGRRFQSARANWSPGTRLALLALAGGVKAFSLRRSAWLRALGVSFGAAVAVRAITNKPFSKLLGFGGRRLVEFHKTLVIDAPVEEVYAYWDNYDHFPEFMSHVREAKHLGNGRSRWTVTGPMGVPVSWIAETSARRPNEVLAWRSAPGSVVKHSGIIQFQHWGDATKLDIQMTYNPPGGFFGHALAWLFRKDPKHALDEDLIRLKTLLEIGKTSVHHRPVIQSEAPLMH